MARWVMDVVLSTGYAGIVFLMCLENVVPPIPSELIMPLAGYLAGSGKLSGIGVVIAGTAGSMLGALPLYYMGRKLGEERLKHLADRYGRWLTVSRKDIERSKGWFDRHGGATVLFCRLIPGIRSLISIPAGISGMNFALFMLYTAIGTAVWTALLVYLGYVLGRNFKLVDQYLDPATWVVFGLIVGAYVYRVVRCTRASRSRDSFTPARSAPSHGHAPGRD
jgi:membrane protein DedA with SNARE-associated domain